LSSDSSAPGNPNIDGKFASKSMASAIAKILIYIKIIHSGG
jgi:hypothetical protein